MIPFRTLTIYFTVALFFITTPTAARALYLDGMDGNDSANGLTTATAWKSLTKANAFAYQPGDSLLFRRGSRQTGQFAPANGSGTAQAPIFVGAYGTGARPLVEAEGLSQDAVVIQNRNYWTLTTLEITNTGAARPTGSGNLRRTGIRVTTDNFGIMRGIVLRDLIVRDVNGSLVKHNTNEGHGILFSATGSTTVNGQLSRFDSLVIEDCRLAHTDRNGISQYTSNGSRSTRVVIQRNLLEDIGGDGIKIWGSDYALVERNTLRGGRMRAQDHAAGMWPFEAKGTVIQFNEVSGMRGTVDGMAYDADYRCDSTLIQYNYSYNNEGGFILMCAPGNSYSTNTVVRYNISVNDGVNSARVIQLGGKITNTRIYNNTFYIPGHKDVPIIASNEWDGGNADSTFFYNNIFHVAPGGRGSYVWDKSTRNYFGHNVFSGNHSGWPTADSSAILTPPDFASPGDTLPGPAGPESYKLLQAIGSSPGSGRFISNNGGRDFFGNPLPIGAPSVGAHQIAGPIGIRPKSEVRIPGKRAASSGRSVDVRGVVRDPLNEDSKDADRTVVPLFTLPE
jgi:hypothetical protein